MKTPRRIILSLLAAVTAGCSMTMRATDAADQSPAFTGFMGQLAANTRYMLGRATGYIPLGSNVRLGPLPSFIGYDHLEGLRLGAGVVTTPVLSPHLRLGGYLAYGFIDHKWKYDFDATWFISPARNASFDTYPVHALTAGFSYDIYPPGLEALGMWRQSRPVRLSFDRHPRMLYRRHGALRYVYEPSRRSEISALAARERYYPSRFIDFGNIPKVDAWRVSMEAMWRPRGDFFQAADRRIDTKPMALSLRGRLQWVEGAQEEDKTTLLVAEVEADKRYPLGSRGMTIALLGHATYTIGHGFYPIMPSLPSGPYLIRRFGSFALLEPMELGADRYVDLHARFDDGALLTGLIPALKPLGIAVTASVDGAFGAPYCRRGPSIEMGALSWRRPYGEVGVGLDRILGILRVEYVWRLSYRDLPGCRRSGISLGLDITF